VVCTPVARCTTSISLPTKPSGTRRLNATMGHSCDKLLPLYITARLVPTHGFWVRILA
jgi:hypothetical protein